MYVIMVYDVNVQRVSKVLHIGRRYLTWVQNSVMEGSLTNAQFKRLKSEIRQVIEEDEDSVLFYTIRSPKDVRREEIGIAKGTPSNFV
ncbi:CRISPR-associated endonuclease Cas2 [Ardenticatena maritima]|uniref:CRISPR-associated endoribonuclease Cas2 n=1 Tax=Ardenticatena maritima TaxID=872965 RepID=A0A0P6XYA3_9CHLR|nr:CRISPR-associated endonuclease Cas2 [Ardenticatena maritima]KPL89581.1 CRISPR-associated protein Cas2 [Ardenticatena maritima]